MIVLNTVIAALVPSPASNALGGSKLQGARQLIVLFKAQVICGAVVSRTDTTWVQLVVLLQPSAICQWRVAVKPGPQGPALVRVLMI